MELIPVPPVIKCVEMVEIQSAGLQSCRPNTSSESEILLNSTDISCEEKQVLPEPQSVDVLIDPHRNAALVLGCRAMMRWKRTLACKVFNMEEECSQLFQPVRRSLSLLHVSLFLSLCVRSLHAVQ